MRRKYLSNRQMHYF